MLTPDELTPILKTYGVSEKESHTLFLALEGKNHKDISERLGIKPEAARKRLGEIYRKFEIEGRGSGKLAKLQQILLTEVQQHRKLKSPLSPASDTSLVDWGNAPEPVQFFGRSQELETLRSQIRPEAAALVSIIGLKGIGKTALTVQILEQCKAEFEVVFWRSLDVLSPQTLSNATQEFLAFVNAAPAEHEMQAIDLLMEQLRTKRCLLVLDGLESLLTQPSAEQDNLSALLTRIGTERHRSCLLLTSRENPKQIVELEGRGHPVYTLTLNGLSVEDAMQLLTAKKLKDDDHWIELIDLFQGNPLALQLITMRIHRFFGGQVREFLQQETITLQQIDDLVSNQFQFLSQQERTLLAWLALKNSPLSFRELKKALKWPGSEVLATLESLMRRSLIQGESQFAIHPLVEKYIVHYLRTTGEITQLPRNNKDIHTLLERCLILPSQKPGE